MKSLSIFLICFWISASTLSLAETQETFRGAFGEAASGKNTQFLNDPEETSVGWMLTESLLQYNPQIGAGGEWSIRFDAERFEKVTGLQPGPGYKHRRIQTTKRSGSLYLLVESDGSGRLVSYIFRTSDFGQTWEFSKGGKTEGEAPKVVKAPPAPSRKKGKEVDLRSMASETPVSPAHPHAHGGPPRAQPIFRVMFDLLLQIRPGANPLTFDNYHSLLLVEIFPRPELEFAFEVSPTPRYYELKYKISETLTMRGGRIWIPFDKNSPHSVFGGFINTSLLRQPGTAAFLPDLWTDLGLGLDWKIVSTPAFSFQTQMYVVNGFRDGGTDPAGEVGTRYPNFENAPTLDSNGDKAMGFRASGNVGGVFGFGASLYSGRYTSQSDDSRRVTLLGADAQLTPWPGTSLSVGYMHGIVGLPSGATVANSIRGGFYCELSQRFAEKWRVVLRGGASQNDNRVQDPSDQTIIGGAISYDFGVIRLSFQYFRDVLDIPGKAVREYTALRAVALF